MELLGAEDLEISRRAILSELEKTNSTIEKICERNKDNEDFNKLLELYSYKERLDKTMNNLINLTTKKVEQPKLQLKLIPKVEEPEDEQNHIELVTKSGKRKDKSGADPQLEADVQKFIERYCIVGVDSAIKAGDFTRKYNDVTGSDLSAIKIGKAMRHIFEIFSDIKHCIKSDATYYTGIAFREDI